MGSKNLTRQDMEPVLEKLQDHLIAKNVASDIATKLCDSVAAKIEGKVRELFIEKGAFYKNSFILFLIGSTNTSVSTNAA